MADQLRSCVSCKAPLELHNIVEERRHGFASFLFIKCHCDVVNKVTTGKRHHASQKEKALVFDINTKAAFGMTQSGVQERQIASFMSVMDIPCMHHSSMRKRLQELRDPVEGVARESCEQALEEEISPSNEQQSDASNNVFKYDMGWQKRGSGRTYDSKSGFGTLIGNKTGKICAYGYRLSDCRTCTLHQNKGSIPPTHDCHKNWSGSSKAMESDVAIQLIKSVEEKGVEVSTLIMDDDTTTMARVRKEIDHDIVKWSDTNHTSKNLSNSLFALQKKHKALTNTNIAYLKKCFNYALAQNKGHVDKCRDSIQQIVPHCFGDHEKCGDWCGYKADPTHYAHKTLHKDLSGVELKQDLQSVFLVYSNNAAKLAPCGSTKDVESFNNMISSKAAKRCHLSATANILTRVGCAVAQKNRGHSYITDVHKKLGVSPGKVAYKEALKRDNERKIHLVYSNKKENKRLRIERKSKKRHAMLNKEKSEGATYQSCIATTHHADVIEIPLPAAASRLQRVDGSLKTIVFCDLETGSLKADADILQIAAICGSIFFNQYVTPRQAISTSASHVTGLTASGNVLFYNGAPVASISLKEALQIFLSWLEERAPTLLVGHNFRVFDFPRLMHAFEIVHLQNAFMAVCVGAVDSLPIFKDIYPGLESYKQDFLVHKFLDLTYSAHNALSDVQSLQSLWKFSALSQDKITQHSFTTVSFAAHLAFKKTSCQNSETLQDLIDCNVISKQMANKIGSSGLRFSHLQNSFSRGGDKALIDL